MYFEVELLYYYIVCFLEEGIRRCRGNTFIIHFSNIITCNFTFILRIIGNYFLNTLKRVIVLSKIALFLFLDLVIVNIFNRV